MRNTDKEIEIDNEFKYGVLSHFINNNSDFTDFIGRENLDSDFEKHKFKILMYHEDSRERAIKHAYAATSNAIGILLADIISVTKNLNTVSPNEVYNINNSNNEILFALGHCGLLTDIDCIKQGEDMSYNQPTYVYGNYNNIKFIRTLLCYRAKDDKTKIELDLSKEVVLLSKKPIEFNLEDIAYLEEHERGYVIEVVCNIKINTF